MQENNQMPNTPTEEKKENEQEEMKSEQQVEEPAQEVSSEEPAPQAQDEEKKEGSSDVEQDKAVTYLSYLGLLFLVPMLVKKESEFAQFHSKQGLVLTIAWFIGGFLYPLFGLGVLIHIAVIVLSVMGLLNVHNGEMKDLPIAGDLAKKFNF